MSILIWVLSVNCWTVSIFHVVLEQDSHLECRCMQSVAVFGSSLLLILLQTVDMPMTTFCYCNSWHKMLWKRWCNAGSSSDGKGLYKIPQRATIHNSEREYWNLSPKALNPSGAFWTAHSKALLTPMSWNIREVWGIPNHKLALTLRSCLLQRHLHCSDRQALWPAFRVELEPYLVSLYTWRLSSRG